MSDEKRLDRIENKVDKVLEQQSESTAIQAAQHVSLKEHMRRTAMLEAELLPIKKHVDMVSAVFKILGAFVALCACTEGVVALLEYLRK